MTPLGIATNGLLSRGARPAEHIATEGLLASLSVVETVEEYRGTGKSKWKNLASLTATPEGPKGKYHYSPQYIAKAEKLEKAEADERELADQVAKTSKKLVYLASERAGARHQRNKLRNELEAQKRALAASMALVERLAAELNRMQREEDEAISMLLLLD